MSELVEVGEIRPGAVVEIPEGLVAYNEAYLPIPSSQLGIFAGADVLATGVVSTLLRYEHAGQFVSVQPKGMALTDKLRVHKTSKLAEELKSKLKAGRLKVPLRGSVSGSDPELFVLDAKGKVIPAWKFLPDKKNALRLSDYPVFWDGFQAEFCPTARECLQQHMDSMQQNIAYLKAKAQAFDPKSKLSTLSTIEVSDDVMRAASDEEVRFRCTPSLNVYRDGGNPTPEPREYKFRFAGGHLHAGFGGRKFTTPVVSEIIRTLDGILGLAGVSLAASFDTPERRKMYGRAGEFRLPQHGIEYRVLSNFWLRHPALSHLVFEIFRGAIKFGEAGLYAIAWEKPSNEEIQEIINNCDVVRARKILSSNVHCLEAILKQKLFAGREYLRGQYMSKDLVPKAIKTILHGLETAIKDPDDLERNWQLGDNWAPLCGNEGASWASL